MPPPTLPPELIRFIVQLVAGISSDTELFRPLAECCLASKTFLPFAREELYRYVEVFQDSGATNLLRTVINAPHLAALIRSLHFELGRSALWRSPTGEETMPQIVAGYVNVTAIFIYSCGQGVNLLTGGAVQRAVASSAETLEILAVKGDCC